MESVIGTPRRLRILCVEDDAMVLQALTSGLEAYNFEVVTAPDGQDALAQFCSFTKKFDAVITDHDMPEMNGLNLVGCLRALGFGGRVIVISGHLTASDCRAYRDLGVIGIFKKPFAADVLAMLLLSK